MWYLTLFGNWESPMRALFQLKWSENASTLFLMVPKLRYDSVTTQSNSVSIIQSVLPASQEVNLKLWLSASYLLSRPSHAVDLQYMSQCGVFRKADNPAETACSLSLCQPQVEAQIQTFSIPATVDVSLPCPPAAEPSPQQRTRVSVCPPQPGQRKCARTSLVGLSSLEETGRKLIPYIIEWNRSIFGVKLVSAKVPQISDKVLLMKQREVTKDKGYRDDAENYKTGLRKSQTSLEWPERKRGQKMQIETERERKRDKLHERRIEK